MVNYRTFQISDDLFWGFSRKIDLDYFDSNEEIIQEMKRQLKLFLQQENFEVLIEKLEKKEFHMPEFGDILIKPELNEQAIIYMCSHCHGNCCKNQDE